MRATTTRKLGAAARRPRTRSDRLLDQWRRRAGDHDARTASELTKVTLQLQWVTQAQFAGYYAAKEQGYYEDEGLDVTIREAGTDIVPQDVLSAGDVDYAISWVPKVLGSIEKGADITDVAQIFERSGTLRSRSRTRASPRRPTSRARRSAAGATATSGSSSPACRRTASTLGDISLVAAGLRHERLPRRRHRRRPGDDLQRVRAGARDQEPRDRRALHARRPQRHQLERRRHRDAPGRHLGRLRQARATTTTPTRR